MIENKKLEERYREEVQSKAEEISRRLYEHPELGNQEVLSSAYLCDCLKEAGFAIIHPYGSQATAFKAILQGEKPGPTFALMAEYDALPGYGEGHDEVGHACGHNWIAAVCVGAALMFAKHKEELQGTLIVMGTPAEETTGGKCVMVEEGAFDDVDFAFQLHLGAENNAHVVTLAMDSLEFTFHGKAAHAASYPHLGINALDAVNLTFTGISYLRQQLRSDTRVHGIITRGGEACNIIPDLCTCQFYIRAADKAYMEEVSQKIVDIAKGAAMMTGTQMEKRNFENTYYDLVNLECFQQHYVENAHAFGVGDFVLSDETASGSSDVGNVSHVCPTMYAELALLGPEPAYAHDAKFLEYLALPCADDKLKKGILSLSKTLLDLMEDEALRQNIQKEFQERIA